MIEANTKQVTLASNKRRWCLLEIDCDWIPRRSRLLWRTVVIVLQQKWAARVQLPREVVALQIQKGPFARMFWGCPFLTNQSFRMRKVMA
jgi:hypothetical protein